MGQIEHHYNKEINSGEVVDDIIHDVAGVGLLFVEEPALQSGQEDGDGSQGHIVVTGHGVQ